MNWRRWRELLIILFLLGTVILGYFAPIPVLHPAARWVVHHPFLTLAGIGASIALVCFLILGSLSLFRSIFAKRSKGAKPSKTKPADHDHPKAPDKKAHKDDHHDDHGHGSGGHAGSHGHGGGHGGGHGHAKVSIWYHLVYIACFSYLAFVGGKHLITKTIPHTLECAANWSKCEKTVEPPTDGMTIVSAGYDVPAPFNKGPFLNVPVPSSTSDTWKEILRTDPGFMIDFFGDETNRKVKDGTITVSCAEPQGDVVDVSDCKSTDRYWVRSATGEADTISYRWVRTHNTQYADTH